MRTTLGMLFGFIMITAASAQQLTPETREAFLRDFATDDAFGRVVAFARFEETVPEDRRAITLAELWDAGKSAVRASILAYLVTNPEERELNVPVLNQRLSRAAIADEPAIRRLALNLAIRRETRETQEIVLDFLTDPDEEIRELALTAIKDRPNSAQIYRSYIQDNVLDGERQRSVAKARFLLERVR